MAERVVEAAVVLGSQRLRDISGVDTSNEESLRHILDDDDFSKVIRRTSQLTGISEESLLATYYGFDHFAERQKDDYCDRNIHVICFSGLRSAFLIKWLKALVSEMAEANITAVNCGNRIKPNLIFTGLAKYLASRDAGLTDLTDDIPIIGTNGNVQKITDALMHEGYQERIAPARFVPMSLTN